MTPDAVEARAREEQPGLFGEEFRSERTQEDEDEAWHLGNELAEMKSREEED